MNVIGYARVSDAEKANQTPWTSIQIQRQEITQCCEREEWRLIDIYEDDGYTGETLERLGFQDALQVVRGREAEIIVVSTLNRAFENFMDYLRLMDEGDPESARLPHWRFHACDLGVDLRSPNGEFMAGMTMASERYQRAMKKQERVRR